MPTLMLLRSPASVTVARASSARRAARRRVTDTSSRSRSSWFGPVAEHGVEHLAARRDHARVRDPGAVEAVGGLAGLVVADLLEGGLVDLLVLARDERRHAADRVRAALVAGADQQLGVGAHERHGHRHRVAVGQQEVAAPGAELLDDGEHVVPAAGVEPGGVVAQLVEDLLHLERGRVGLDQHGRADRALRDAERVLRVRRTRRSTAAPRGGSPSWAGRSTGRGPASICSGAQWKK